MNNQKLATGLGWFSIGLGIAELVATKPLAKLLQKGKGDTEGKRGQATFPDLSSVGISLERLTPYK